MNKLNNLPSLETISKESLNILIKEYLSNIFFPSLLNKSDVEALDAGGFLKTFGFKRLADDPPHIEMARLGGVFNGPDSGYPVMLHGTEAVLPSVQLEEVKSMMGSVSKTSLGSELPSITNNTSTNNDDTLNALRDLYDVMADKLDTVIDKLASGNDIQDKLLRNSMV